MNKTLSKEIMKRSNLRNKYLKSRSEEDRQRFRKQRNLCVSLLRKTKRSYYSNLNEKNVIDNRKFWKTVKPMLSNKFVNNEKITLVDNEKIITNDKEIAKVLNDFFSNIIKTLNIPKKDHTDSIVENVRDPTFKSILKYRKHPSILAIKRRIKSGPVFILNQIIKEDVLKEIKKLKENSDIFSNFIYQSFNNMIDVCIFPKSLKLANVTPVYKKASNNSKESYRPVSILPNISKNYKRCLFKPISNYLENNFFKFHSGFRQGVSAQHSLIPMAEKWKKSLDKEKTFAALLTDLSKAFCYLPHDLIIAKRNAYGFS